MTGHALRHYLVIPAAALTVLAAAVSPRGGAGARTAGVRPASACAAHATSRAAAVGQAAAYSSAVAAAPASQAVQAPAEMKTPGRPNISVAPGEDKPLPRRQREDVPPLSPKRTAPQNDDQELSRGGLPLAGTGGTAATMSTPQVTSFSARCH